MEKVSLGFYGECYECMCVTIEAELLKELKKKQLKKFAEYDNTSF